MASQVNPPRGMRDFVPSEKAQRERVLRVIRDTYRAHGFDEIETPVMEESSRLNSGLGGDNEKLSFGVLKRGLDKSDFEKAETALDLVDLGLRFDLTVPLARFYATHRGELPTVFKAIQIAPVWRAERPQKGRYRQFVQCDIDIIGEQSTIAEAELIAATSAALSALGLTGWSIRVNDRRLLHGMLDALGFERSSHDTVLITLDKLDKIGADGVVAELRDRGFAADALGAYLAQPAVTRSFDEQGIRSALPDGADDTAVRELASLTTDGVPIVFDPFLVRGMGYYTGAIFEVAHDELGYSLAGGGRYDGMIGRFLGTDVPAVGFSIGFERIVDLANLPAADSEKAIALIHDGVAPAELLQLKAQLIADGARVRLDRKPKNLRPLLESLAASGYSHYALVTPGSDLDLRELA